MSEEIKKQFTEEEIKDQEKRVEAFHKRMCDSDFANSCVEIIRKNGNLQEFLKTNGIELTDDELAVLLDLVNLGRENRISEEDLEALKRGELTENMLSQINGGSASDAAKNIDASSTVISSVGGIAAVGVGMAFPPAGLAIAAVVAVTSIILSIFGSVFSNKANKEAKAKAETNGRAITSTSKF